MQQFDRPRHPPQASAHSSPLHRRGSPPPSRPPLCAPHGTSASRPSGLSRARLWSPPLSIQGSGEKGTAHPLPHPLPRASPLGGSRPGLCAAGPRPWLPGLRRGWEQPGREQGGQKGRERWMTEKPCGEQGRGGEGSSGPPRSCECAHRPSVCVCSKSRLCWLPPSRTRRRSGVGSPRRSPGEAAGPPTTTAAIAAKKAGTSYAATTARPPSTSSAGKVWGPLLAPRRHIPSPGLPLPAEITGACSR